MRGAGWMAMTLASLAIVGCKAKPGDTCRTGTAECLDRAHELSCQGGKYLAAPCRGPAGCTERAGEISCDVSSNVPGDPCSTEDEDKGSCSVDLANQVVCRAGKYEVHPCRGPAHCKPTATGSSCDMSVAEENDPCTSTGDACSVDRSALLSCRGGKFVVSSRCRGPAACHEVGGDKLVCDNSLAMLGDPCNATGGSCSVDRKSLLVCKDGTFQLDSSCRGPDGCASTANEKLTCDMSIAQPDDPCESGHACSADGKGLLRCKDGKFVLSVTCPRACKVTGEAVGCGG